MKSLSYISGLVISLALIIGLSGCGGGGENGSSASNNDDNTSQESTPTKPIATTLATPPAVPAL